MIKPARRLTALITCLVLVVPTLVIGVSSAMAKTKHYPAAVERVFVSACVKSAVATGTVNRKQATTYCKATLACIEAHMSLKQFEANPSSRTVTKCEQAAIKKVKH